MKRPEFEAAQVVIPASAASAAAEAVPVHPVARRRVGRGHDDEVCAPGDHPARLVLPELLLADDVGTGLADAVAVDGAPVEQLFDENLGDGGKFKRE